MGNFVDFFLWFFQVLVYNWLFTFFRWICFSLSGGCLSCFLSKFLLSNLFKICQEFVIFIRNHIDTAWLSFLFNDFFHLWKIFGFLLHGVYNKNIWIANSLCKEVFYLSSTIISISSSKLFKTSSKSSIILMFSWKLLASLS